MMSSGLNEEQNVFCEELSRWADQFAKVKSGR